MTPRAIRRLVRRLCGDRRGGVTILTAISILALLASTALAVDMGSLYVARRTLQGTADAAALAAVDLPTDQTGAAQRTIAANGLSGAGVAAVTPGSYAPNAAVAAGQRFVAGGAPANAVRLGLVQDVPIYFGGIFTGQGSARVAATATATRIDYAAFSIGTRLASVQGGLPAALLSALAGTSVNLSLLDYNSLLGANVDLFAFTQALATQLHLTGASFGDTLAAQATLPQVLNALAAATGNAGAAGAYRSLALTVPGVTLSMANLIDLGPYAGSDHADPGSSLTVDGYSILQAAMQLAGGQRQASVDLGLTLPGITATTATLAIGQRAAGSPWLAVARDGSVIVRTSAARLYLDSQVGGAATLGLLSLRLPVYIELAQGQARLNAITCAHGQTTASVALDVLPSPGTLAIADLDRTSLFNFAAPVVERSAVIATAPLFTVSGRADIALSAGNWQTVLFSPADIAANATKTVTSDSVVQGVASSLVGKLNLQVTALGFGVNASPVAALVGAALTPVAPGLDGVLNQLTALLGVHVGQADVRIDGLRCGKPTLVA